MTSYYRKKWSSFDKATVTAEQLRGLSRQVAYSFLDYYMKDMRYEEDCIDLLCEITTSFEDPALSDQPAKALFGIIIESLCDDFEELHTTTYNRVMTQVITHCRSVPAGSELDATLKSFDVHCAKDLFNRLNEIRNEDHRLPPPEAVKKVILLSRITIGADVAVTSVAIQRMGALYPDAKLALIGGGQLEELYGGNPQLTLREIQYSRKGGLLERLLSWHDVLQIVHEEMADAPEETILLDPDSRLSQLGALPLIEPERYFFFDSRSHNSLNNTMSMPELTNAWIDRLCGSIDGSPDGGRNGEGSYAHPSLWLPAETVELGRAFCESLRSNGAKHIFVVNLGVGGNERKRVGRELEERLLLELLEQPDTVIVLDKGFGDEELAYANALVEATSAGGYATAEAVLGDAQAPELSWGVVGVQSRIGEIAALIASSDEFIGYDSACQHMAVAQGVPCITVFAGSNNTRFIRRWSASGSGPSAIVHVDTLTNSSGIEVEDIIDRIRHLRFGHEHGKSS
jgi:ADP-heptose:LPS heptosyltransferase